MDKISPCLWFDDAAEEAARFYVSLFPNSRIVNVVRSEGGIIPAGRVMAATFELDGRPYNAFDGGDSFSFTEGFSLMVTCETQDEIDRLVAKREENPAATKRLNELKETLAVLSGLEAKTPDELDRFLGMIDQFLNRKRPFDRELFKEAVGPVTAASPFENGATITRSFGRRNLTRRLAASLTKSIRRLMLWLLSISRAKVVATDS